MSGTHDISDDGSTVESDRGDNLLHGEEEETDPKTVALSEYAAGSYSPDLTSSGNLQCAQRDYDSSGNIVKVEVLEHFDSSFAPDSYSSRDIQFDEFDTALDGLPKESYISKLLQISEANEDTLSRYRSELAVRARRCNDGPSGALITRRSSAKSSIVEKYASDCFVLNSFICGNSVDINELFKQSIKQTGSARLNSTCHYDDGSASLQADVSNMKETIAQLLADVSLIKENVTSVQNSLDVIQQTMKGDISILKAELEACNTGVMKSINSDTFPNYPDMKTFSDRLTLMGRMTRKLEKSRCDMELKLVDLETGVRDNANGLRGIQDTSYGNNTAAKSQLKDLQTQVEQIAADYNKYEENATANCDFMTNVAKKVKTLEKNTEGSSVKELNESFKKFSSNMESKIDRLCNVVEKAVTLNTRDTPRETQAKPTLSIFTERIGNNLTRDPSTGLMSRGKDPKLTGDRIESQTGNFNNANQEKGEMCMAPAKDNVKDSARPIPVISSSTTTSKGFRGVLRRRVRRYFLSGIDPGSTEADLRDFLNENDVTHTEVRFFKSRRSESILAKVTIWEDNAATVESEGFWPYGVKCRPWMTRPELRNYYKYQNEQTDHVNEDGYEQY